MTERPSGSPPPESAYLADGATLDLRPLATTVCARYDAEFPDERERYGPAGKEWCVHDNLWLFAWAVADAESGTVSLNDQVAWLGRILAARDFPLDRLARDLDIAAEVVLEAHPALTAVAERMRTAAATLR